MPKINLEDWEEINPKDEKEVGMCLNEISKQCDHYKRRTIKDLASYITGKVDVVDFIVRGEDFSISVLLYCKNKTKMTKQRTACIGHAWYKGNIEWSDSMDAILEKAKAYAKEHECTQIAHAQPKNMKDDGPCSDFKFTKPYNENKNYVRLEKHFSDVKIEETDRHIYILVTL